MRTTWYFDFISPYCYFASRQLERLPASTELRPVLFAGLLNHWGQKGPVEIPTKRVWTYRACVRYAQQHDIPFCLPTAHPFNPLQYLRLCIAAGATVPVVRRIFTELWTTGCDPADPNVLRKLADELGVQLEQLSDPQVKDALRSGTEAAAAAGVFGVPTLRVGHELFWGNDALDFALEYYADPGVLEHGEMRRTATLPIGVARPGA
jgi:2-hydroxychromene-2-carboxylate isomerase